MRLLFEPRDEPAGPLQCQVEIVDAKKPEEPIAWCRVVRTHQGGMLVRAPLVEAEQDGSVRVEDLTEVVMAKRRPGLTEDRLMSETRCFVLNKYLARPARSRASLELALIAPVTRS